MSASPAEPYILHYFPGNASLLPHMMLREIGAPFELRLVDRAVEAQRSPAYLRLNPHGRIPVLEHGRTVLCCTRPPPSPSTSRSGTPGRSWRRHRARRAGRIS